MSESTDRTLEPLDAVHRRPDELVEETVRAIEGVVQQGHLSVEVLMVTEEMVMVKVRRAKGLIDPSHVHEDHESVATLISGRMRNYIGDQEFISEAGSVWRHPPGVVHSSEALEDCVQIEVKTPARKTWT
ncbi:MAG TPA: cupin domain-containing protein [Gammaproteobacteria bacterium]|nr:cupin domain-containing protein [Gammaproteobacteria bacterium]